MQEYKDGSYGEILPKEDIFKKLMEDASEAERTVAVHLGTKEALENKKVLDGIMFYGETFLRVEEKLDRIIRHFNIVKIIGE